MRMGTLRWGDSKVVLMVHVRLLKAPDLGPGIPRPRPWFFSQEKVWGATVGFFFLWSCRAILCLVTQSCRTLCNPMDCSLPGSSDHGILQARILEWVAMPSSRGSSQHRDQT